MLALLLGCQDEGMPSRVTDHSLSLPDLEGRSQPLVSPNKVRIVNLWATWCAPCREEMPALQALSDRLQNSQLELVGITVDRDINLVREFLLKYDIRFPQLLDSDMSVATNILSVRAYPETLLIDSEGRVLQRWTGSRRWDDPSTVRQFLVPLPDNISRPF